MEDVNRLKQEIEKLEEELREKEEDIQRAAEIGNCLLEENALLKDKLENSIKSYSDKIEQLQQDNYSIQLKLDSKTANEEWFNTEISHLKADCQIKTDQIKESLEAERIQQVSQLQRKVDDLQSDLEKSQKTEKDLQSQIVQLEDLVQQGLNQTEIISKSFLNDEIGELKTELMELKNENTTLKSQLIEGKSEYQKIKVEIEGLKNKLIAKTSELEEVQCQTTTYLNLLENSRTEILDLKTEMEALRMETSGHKKKGNSLFSELEDRRVDAEKKLISIKTHFESLKEKYELEKQHNHKLKMQMVVLLQMSKGSADTDRVNQLESRLSQERAEKQELMLRIHDLELKQASQSEALKGLCKKGEKTQPADDDYVQYLLTLIETKEKEILKLNSDMEFKSMQLLDKKNNVFALERKIYDLENDREKIRCLNLKLKLEMEELKLKYDPESVKNDKKPVQYRTEKLPMPDKENVEQKSKPADMSVLDDLPDSVFLPSRSAVTVLSPKPCNHGNKRSIRTNSKGKTVSISESVKVKDVDGECNTEALSETEKTSLEKSEKQNRPKGRTVTKIKEIRPANVKDINDCKSQ